MSLSKPDEMTIPQPQIIYRIEQRKVAQTIAVFLGGNSGINKLKSKLNNSNKAFLDKAIKLF